MRIRVVSFFGVLVCTVMMIVSASAQSGLDPSGTWTGTWGPSPADRNNVTVVLKWDGKALTGTVNPGPNQVELMKTMFDSKTGAIHMEADVQRPGGGSIHYVIDGKVEQTGMSGTWNHDNRKGDFRITK